MHVVSFLRTGRWLRLTAALFSLAFLTAFPAAAQFTGSWSGTYSQQEQCAQRITYGGKIAVDSIQSGSSVSGSMTVDLYKDICTSDTPTSVTLPMNGTVSGNTLNGVVFLPDAVNGVTAQAFVATISGSQMSMTTPDSGDAFSASLTQTSSQPPATGLSGNYSGTISGTDIPQVPCSNNPNLTWSGTISASLTESGAAVTGFVDLSAAGLKDIQRDASGNCALVDNNGTLATLLTATLSGNALTGALIADRLVPFAGTVSDSTISISGTTPATTFTFTMSKSSTTPKPQIANFVANPATIQAGNSTNLQWVTVNASAVSIDNGVGTRPANGAVAVTPSQTTTYTLTATGTGGTATASTTVAVTAAPTPATLVVSAFPEGMLQATGAALPTDRYTITNVGGTGTEVTIGKIGSFFTQDPTSFHLEPNGSAVIFITAVQQPVGSYDGKSTISGSGAAADMAIPIHLVVAAAPPAPVMITASTTRSELTAPAGQSPSGSVSFTNSSSSTISGVVVADAAWIIVANPALVLGPNETKSVQYSIDRSQRPDASALVGGAAGTLTFRYINTALGKATIQSTTVQSNLSVSIVDIVTLGTSAAAPPPLGNGEIAYFVTGASSKGAFGDLALSNASDTPIGDLKMYFGAAGASAWQLAAPPAFPANGALSFPSVIKSIFGQSSSTGTLQFRSSQLANVALGQSQTTTTLGQDYVTSLPIFRSGAGFDAGADLLLPGVQKSGTLSTTLYLQEVLGLPATISIDFFDAAGQLVSSRTGDALTAFGSIELADVVPAGAVTARIRNGSSNGARINGYGLVKDSATGDAFTVVQLGGPNDPTFVPAFAAASGSRDVVISMTNIAANPITVTTTAVAGGSGRRRVAGHGLKAAASATRSATEFVPAVEDNVTIPVLGMRQVTVSQTGFVKLSGAGAVRSTARFTASKNGGTYGSGLVVSSAARGIPVDTFRRFAGVEDSTEATIAASRPHTYRTNVMLIESSGQPATIRLTLRYIFSAGATVSAGAVASRDINVAPGSFVLLTNIGEAILGPARENYGDFHNATLDVANVSGPGAVIPYLQLIENASGDVAIRQ